MEPSEKDGIFWMKRAAKWEVALLIGLMVSLAWGCWADRTQRELADQVLRLHVLANADSEADQALKLKVRDGMFALIEGLFAGCTDQEEALQTARDNRALLEAVETGAGLYYSLMYEDNTILLNTQFTSLYSTNYALWTDRMAQQQEALSALYASVATSRMTGYTRLT